MLNQHPLTPPPELVQVMTIEEAKAAKCELLKQIHTAIANFTKRTGLLIDAIDVSKAITMDGKCSYYVDAEVKLGL